MTAYIIGSGTSVPERVITNEDIAEKLGLTPEQMVRSSGIRRRRWAEAGTTTSELATEALAVAIESTNLSKFDLDYLLLGTMTPDRFIPGSAPAVQNRLGLPQIPSLDIRAACCNCLYGLQLAKALVVSGTARSVAVCLAEVQSAWLDVSPVAGTTSMLFGDGAAALLVSSEPQKGAWEIMDIALEADGAFTDDLGVRCPGTEFGVRRELADTYPRMVGQSVILQASRKIVGSCNLVLERNGLTPQGVQWMVPHQANTNLLAHVAKALRFPIERVVSLLEDFGNTSSASMGMAVDQLRRAGEAQTGDMVLMPAFGAGFTWGAGLCRVW